MSGSLPLKYRPDDFEFLYGNDHVVDQLKTIIKREEKNRPKAWLFTGESGTGKTTVVRILRDKFDCNPSNFYEYNSSSERGIDAVRTLSANARMSAMGGGCKIFLLDECFAKNTKVLTLNGEVPIKDIKINDSVFSLNGFDTVTATAIKKVPLDRVVAVKKSNGTVTVCSKEHPYYINGKWVEAKDLTSRDILSYTSENVFYTNSQIGDKNGTKTLFAVQKNIYTKSKCTKILLKTMFRCIKGETNLVWKMRDLWKKNQKTKQILLSKLCRKMEECTTRDKSKNVYKGMQGKYKEGMGKVYKNRESKESIQSFFRENEEKQPINYARNNRETNNVKEVKWYSIFQRAWREWTWSYSSRKVVISSIREFMEIQFCCFSREATTGIPNVLQNRCCTSSPKNRNRSRRWFPQFKNKERTGQKERKEVGSIRVESIAFYKSGDNREYFKGIIGDTERNQGYVEFYDLTIRNHPSFIADGNMVHNCHNLTPAAQQALLKILEDTPPKTYFMLATTNPEKLLKAIKTRCTTVALKICSIPVLKELCLDIANEEEVDLSPKVAMAISKASSGSPREALKILDQVIDIEDEEKAINAVEKTIGKMSIGIEICQEFMGNCKWTTIGSLISKVLEDTEPESLRRLMMGYFNKISLSKDNMRSDIILAELVNIHRLSTEKGDITNACKAAYSVIQDVNGTGDDVPF